MKTNSIQITLAAAAFSLACKVEAQYTLDWHTISGGGGVISGGGYSLDGTVGQPAAGNLSGGSYALEGGYRAGVISAPTLSITPAGTMAVLSCTGSGFVLQSADEVSGPWADLSPGATADGVHSGTNTPVSGRKRFFRLRASE